MEKRVLRSAAILAVAFCMAGTSGTSAQALAPSRDVDDGGGSEQIVKYRIPDNAYFSSADPGHYPTVPYVDPPFPYYYKLRIISPTNNEILFTDVSEGVAGEPQWSVNTTERPRRWKPMKMATCPISWASRPTTATSAPATTDSPY